MSTSKEYERGVRDAAGATEAERITEACPHARLLRENPGWADGYNSALDDAKASILALLPADSQKECKE